MTKQENPSPQKQHAKELNIVHFLTIVLQLTCLAGGTLLASTGVISSLTSLFLYHPASAPLNNSTITLYLLQTIAGFSAVATAHYLKPFTHQQQPAAGKSTAGEKDHTASHQGTTDTPAP